MVETLNGAAAPYAILLDLAQGDVVEVHAASFGAGGAPIVPGRATTFVTVEAV